MIDYCVQHKCRPQDMVWLLAQTYMGSDFQAYLSLDAKFKGALHIWGICLGGLLTRQKSRPSGKGLCNALRPAQLQVLTGRHPAEPP